MSEESSVPLLVLGIVLLLLCHLGLDIRVLRSLDVDPLPNERREARDLVLGDLLEPVRDDRSDLWCTLRISARERREKGEGRKDLGRVLALGVGETGATAEALAGFHLADERARLAFILSLF